MRMCMCASVVLVPEPKQTSIVASFPGSSAPERDIEVVHACTFRVPESLGTRLANRTTVWLLCMHKPSNK